VRTIAGTVAAEDFFAAMAVIPLLLVDCGITVVARHTVPVLQFDIGPPLGIGLERLMDDREEVVQSAGRQGRTDGPQPIACAQRLVIDVWMSDVAIGTGRIGLQSHDSEFLGYWELLQVQADFESSQRNSLQDNRFGGDTDGLGLQIALELFKFCSENR
jgi:hypothetical protein